VAMNVQYGITANEPRPKDAEPWNGTVHQNLAFSST
jgi:hypothetical protein